MGYIYTPADELKLLGRGNRYRSSGRDGMVQWGEHTDMCTHMYVLAVGSCSPLKLFKRFWFCALLRQ